MRWVSTGPPILPMLAVAWVTKVALQGNMDPSMLYASAPRIEEEVATILAGFGQGKATSLTLDTVFIRTLTPSMRASLLRLCTVCPHPITSRR